MPLSLTCALRLEKQNDGLKLRFTHVNFPYLEVEGWRVMSHSIGHVGTDQSWRHDIEIDGIGYIGEPPGEPQRERSWVAGTASLSRRNTKGSGRRLRSRITTMT
jgi:hypothetical protein